MTFKKFNYNEHAKTSDPDDLWGQVKRTINGKPFTDDQIALIVDAIRDGLDLQPSDVVLDIGCGNGALSDRIFAQCRGGLGVDLSEVLIGVANKHFGSRPDVEYLVADAATFVADGGGSDRFSKALCYGAFMYLSIDEASTMLRELRRRYPHIERVFLGNLPDKSRMHDFYYEGEYVSGIENAHDTAIGVWRTEEEFMALGDGAGWSVMIRRMPPAFKASIYRYDAILEKR